jgi:hypothetical protein
MKKILFLMLIAFCVQTQLWAVPAYPYPIEITQPDGSNLTVIQKGDEFYSWIETVDGYSILSGRCTAYCLVHQ